MSALSDATIRRLVEEGRIGVEPWDPGLIQPSSIDLRLGDSFRVFHNHRITAIDLRDPPDNLTEEVVVGEGEPFVIHPGEFCLGRTLEWVELPAGQAALDQGHDNVLPQRTLAAIQAHKVALKGPVTTPVGKGFKSVNVQLRKALNLYAAVRPVRSLEGVKTRFSNVNIVIVRENTEGLYSGIENEVVPGVVTSLKVATEVACTRISRFEYWQGKPMAWESQVVAK